MIQGKSSLTTQEQQAATLAVSFENSREYCMGAHCPIAATARLPGATIPALRKGTLPEDVKTVALVKCTRAVVKQRIWV